MLRAYKYRIYPTKVQAVMIDKTIGVCRLLYNLALETKKYAYFSHGKNLSGFDLINQLPELKNCFLWMKEVDSQALQSAVRKLDIVFANFFKGYGFPRFKIKRNGGTFQCQSSPRKIDWIKSTLTIPKIKNISIALSRKFEGKIKTVTISKTPTGKYFASILVETDDLKVIPKEVNPETTIGIDLGIKSFVVSSDGKSFEANRKLKNNLERLKCLSKRASRKKKGSNNRKKANKCLAIIHEKITNQRTDYIHKVTSLLVKGDNQTIMIEDLNVAGMLKNRKLSQAISDVSFGEFVRQMKYKCDWYGKNLIQIGRFEPSSKMCSHCQVINETLTLQDREWTCASCGTLHDRDFNAAKNIRQIGLNNSSRGTAGEPVELLPMGRTMKQEFFNQKP